MEQWQGGPGVTQEDSMTYEEFLAEVANKYSNTVDHRYGQVFFNTLMDQRPDLSEQIRATKLDPFHRERDTMNNELYNWLQSNW